MKVFAKYIFFYLQRQQIEALNYTNSLMQESSPPTVVAASSTFSVQVLMVCPVCSRNIMYSAIGDHIKQCLQEVCGAYCTFMIFYIQCFIHVVSSFFLYYEGIFERTDHKFSSNDMYIIRE